MSSDGTGFRRAILLVLAAAVAGTFVAVYWLRSSGTAAASRLPTPSTVVRTPADFTAEIAALEESLRQLDQGSAQVMRKYFDARRKTLAATGKDALARELQDAQRALSDAIENHPRMVALKQQMARAEDQANGAYSNQTAVLAQIQAKREARFVAAKTQGNDIWARQDAERRKEILVPSGKKDFTKLTPEEQQKLVEIQDKYIREYRAMEAKIQEEWKHPDEKEQALVVQFKSLAEQRDAGNKQYSEIYNSLSNERTRIAVEDPAVAALAARVADLNVRRNASVAASADLAPYDKQLEDLQKQRADIVERLNVLKRQAAGVTPVAAQVPTGKHG